MKPHAPSKPPEPWRLPALEHSDIVAIQAIEQGIADQYQQRIAWAAIREKLCEVERMTFWPGGEDGRRASDFAEGKRWVAIQLRRISRLKPRGIDSRGEPPPMPADTQTEDGTNVMA